MTQSARRRTAADRPPGLDLERAFWDAGLTAVAGVDEVGRGALAGPLVAAAVVLPHCAGSALRRLRGALAGVRDSKTVPPPLRQVLADRIIANAWAFAVGLVEADELDVVGLAAANRLAMERAVLTLRAEPEALLLDACLVDLGLPQVGQVRGDARCLSVAAASIVAKVHRDRLMAAHHAADERYGFAVHKGYGTAAHLAALRRYGPGPLHRRSFALPAPVPPSEPA